MKITIETTEAQDLLFAAGVTFNKDGNDTLDEVGQEVCLEALDSYIERGHKALVDAKKAEIEAAALAEVPALEKLATK